MSKMKSDLPKMYKLCKRFRFIVGFALGVCVATTLFIVTIFFLYFHFDISNQKVHLIKREYYRGGYEDGQLILQNVVDGDQRKKDYE